jgi:serine/threonine protein kinase
MKFCKICGNMFPDDIVRCIIDGAELAAAEDGNIGQLIGGCYRVLSMLAEGGMSKVYAARHMYLNRDVAIKILKPALAARGDLRERVLREARICGTIEHPNIVKVYDMLMTRSQVCIVMELLEGETLKARLRRRGPFDLAQVNRIVSMTAEALARAHSLGIVHRDIKPTNIFLISRNDIDDFVKLLDFGIAFTLGEGRLTKQGGVVGSPPYFSPEQIRGGEPVKATDIYALGCVVYELLSGRTPFASDKLEDVIAGHMGREPEPLTSLRPDVPMPYETIVSKMLAKNAEDRYQDAFELLYALKGEGYYMPRSGGPGPERESKAELEMRDESTDTQWDAYFKQIELRSSAAPEHHQSFFEGLESVKELMELETKTRDVIRLMETIEHKRRSYQRNIGSAIEVLGMDLSKLRMERAADKMEYIKMLSEKDHVAAQLRLMKENLARVVRPGTSDGDRELGDEDIAILAEAGRLAARFQELVAGIRELGGRRESYKSRMEDVKYQLSQLDKSLKEVEAECAAEYEKHRKTLDELSARAEKLRQAAAQAASRLGPASSSP